jgi:prepilin-type N-terminal cleavage/methylation domain-containing protein
MSSRRAGFTIIELLISLAVSGAIFIAGISVFTSRKSNTEFDQAVYDLQSKIQNLASQSSSKALPISLGCKLQSGKPVLASTFSSTGECIYLGYAIQVIPNGSTIYSYPVFASRSYTTSPAIEPALDSNTTATAQQYIEVDTYPMLGGLKVSSANVSGSASASDLLTLYSSLQNVNTSGNELDAAAVQVTFSSTDARQTGSVSGSTDNLRTCIEGSSCGAGSITSLNNNTAWKLCVTDGRRSALLSIRGVATGVTIKLNINACT